MMKNKLDERIDEALAESPCEDESVAEDENWWMKYAKFPTEESDGQSIPLCLVPDLVAEAERLERERIRGMIEDKLEWYEELGGRINHSTLRDILSKLSNE